MNFKNLDKKKARLAGFRPMTAAAAKNLEAWLRVELTYSSNAIEGNTLTRQETALVVEKGLTVGGHPLREHLEAANHAKALDRVEELARSQKPLGEKELLELHALVLKGVYDEQAGRYRDLPVRISGSQVVLPNPRKVFELMAAFGAWLAKGHAGLHPVAFASEAHLRLVTIHPFADGNGRVARLLASLLLLREGFTPLWIRPKDRAAYLASLEQTQLGGSPEPYERLMAKAVERTLDLYLRAAAGLPPRGARSARPGALTRGARARDSKAAGAPSAALAKLLRIGQLAKLCGETPSTLRHWMRLGLLEAAQTRDSGYTYFDSAAQDRVALIRRLQAQRLSLDEVKDKLVQGNT